MSLIASLGECVPISGTWPSYNSIATKPIAQMSLANDVSPYFTTKINNINLKE